MEALSERFEKRVDEVLAQYPDFHRGIYRHVFRSLEAAGRRASAGAVRCVSVMDFVKDGLVPLAVENWGILAPVVFRFWGIETGADLRKVLERLVQFKVFKRDADERLEVLNTLDLKEIFLDRLKNR
jgi:uncharacterized repeat protein (TIGR04138 family)